MVDLVADGSTAGTAISILVAYVSTITFQIILGGVHYGLAGLCGDCTELDDIKPKYLLLEPW